MSAAPALALRLLPGVWLGLLLAVALLATPAPFVLLAQADAGRVVARILRHEAAIALVVGAALLVAARVQAKRDAAAGRGSQFSAEMLLAAGALLCTVAGYYAVQPMMVAARAGRGGLGFGALHAISSVFYAVKVGLVAALAWRAACRPAAALSPATSS